MSKTSIPEPIQSFAAQTRINVAAWSMSQTPTNLMIDGIATLNHAERLRSFLTERGMLATITMGDRRGQTWIVIARDRIPSLLEDE